MINWINIEDLKPEHGQKVISKGKDGREFKTQYWHWGEELKPYFKLRGQVWDHDDVVCWREDD